MSGFPSRQLLKWYDLNKRILPWRESCNPYHIWVSEVMLQQTKVDTVIPYYNRFIREFPKIEHFAAATQQQVLKLWEGLGYYSRARNLHAAAKTVVNDYQGAVPDSYDEIIRLKGVGPYTASAILSIAYDKPHAVTDGNVFRVLARYYGIKEDIRSQRVRNNIGEIASSILYKERPGDYNQALMELGATVCTPVRPDCTLCPLSADCVAYRTAATDKLPYKSPAKKIPHHQIGVGLITDNAGHLLIAQRPEDAMLGGLWEFPGGKQNPGETMKETVERELREELGVEVLATRHFMDLKHAYSHFRITMHAYRCKIVKGNPRPVTSQQIRWVGLDQLEEFPFPKANKVLVQRLIRDGITD